MLSLNNMNNFQKYNRKKGDPHFFTNQLNKLRLLSGAKVINVQSRSISYHTFNNIKSSNLSILLDEKDPLQNDKTLGKHVINTCSVLFSWGVILKSACSG